MLRGQVWLVNLNPTVGSEIRKTRPSIIVNDNAIGILPLKVVVPVTDWKDDFAIRPWMVKLEPSVENGLAKISAVDTFQIRSVSQIRLIRQLGQLSELEIHLVSQALSILFSIKILIYNNNYRGLAPVSNFSYSSLCALCDGRGNYLYSQN